MTKYFTCSDCHGFYTEMKKALDDAGFDENNPEHKLILVGDAMDRGEEPLEMLKYLEHLQELNKLIFVLGNHEDLFDDCYYENKEYGGWDISRHHIHNGTYKTVTTLGDKYCKEWMDFKSKYGLDYFETEHYIFVHGWIPINHAWSDGDEWNSMPILTYREDWREADKSDWEDARWLNGFEAWHQGLNKTNKTIVFGHITNSYAWHEFRHDGVEYVKRIETCYYNSEGKLCPYMKTEPFIDDGIIGLDTCTVLTKKVNVVVIEE